VKKLFYSALLFVSSICAVSAVDIKSYNFIEYLLSLHVPAAPEVFEDAVVFTAPSRYHRVGIAFSHENFGEIHWFKKLLVPINETAVFDPASKVPPEMLKDSGILFCAYTVPQFARSKKEFEYRLIMDGIWLSDPLNPSKRFDFELGAEVSITSAPAMMRDDQDEGKAAGILTLNYTAPSGEAITVAGDFNGWDPFMYQLREVSTGKYRLQIPLPAGTWRYALFHRGKRVLDPSNLDKVYAKDGMIANVIDIK
jgi:hypothetical protein